MSLQGEKKKESFDKEAKRKLVWLNSGSMGNSNINHFYLIELYTKRNVHLHILTVLQQ